MTALLYSISILSCILLPSKSIGPCFLSPASLYPLWVVYFISRFLEIEILAPCQHYKNFIARLKFKLPKSYIYNALYEHHLPHYNKLTTGVHKSFRFRQEYALCVLTGKINALIWFIQVGHSIDTRTHKYMYFSIYGHSLLHTCTMKPDNTIGAFLMGC